MVEITYHKEGDYFIPDLYLEKEEYEKDYIIGKYGHLTLEYLKSHKKAEYTILFMDCTLRKHIVETDKQAKKRFDIKRMLRNNPFMLGIIIKARPGILIMSLISTILGCYWKNKDKNKIDKL